MWAQYVKKLEQSCDRQYPNRIPINTFFKIMNKFEIKLNQEEQDDLIECFHLKDEGNQKEINITPIFEFDKAKAINKVYKSIDLEQKEDDEELSAIHQRLMPVSEEEFFKILSKNPSINELNKEIKKVDRDSNGFLTKSELNTVFHAVYPDLQGKSLFKLLRPFASIQNKTLVDYRKLKEYIQDRLETYFPQSENDEFYNKNSRNPDLKESLTYTKGQGLVSPRGVRSPSMRRMEQIKDEILKAAESSPLLQANKHLVQRHHEVKSPKLHSKTALDALASPRERYLPQLRPSGEITKPTVADRLMSPDRVSMSKFSQYSTFSSPFFTKANQALKQKLEYEWKHIYRALNSIDLNSSGYVTKKEFLN